MNAVSRRSGRTLAQVAALLLLLALAPFPQHVSAKGLLSVTTSPTTPQHANAFGHLPISFERNVGQVDSQVAFLAHVGGSTLFLTRTGFVFTVPSGSTAHNPRTPRLGRENPFTTKFSPPAPSVPTRSAVTRFVFVAANAHPQLTGMGQLQGKVNYFIGNDPKKWHTDIPTYSRVGYHNVYRGIDLVFYGNGHGLEYDWLVHPGARPSSIRLRVQGAAGIKLDLGSNLLLDTAGGRLIQGKPSLYQSGLRGREAVGGHYVLSGKGMLGVRVGNYDTHRTLVIDPALAYSTYLGGSAGDQGEGIAVDSAGSTYVTGLTISANFPTHNAFQATSGGGYMDAFITKLSPDGTSLLYSTFLGGSAYDWGSAIAVDSAGSALITGGTGSSDFPTHTALQATFGGGQYDAFITKLSPDGTRLVYSTYLGGVGSDHGQGIAVDSAGGAYVTGGTESANFPTHNGLQTTFGGNSDVFITKLSPDGTSLVYSTYLGGSGDDHGSGIAVDSAGSAYVTGNASSANFPTYNPLQVAFGGGSYDAFIAKLSSNGTSLVYSTYLGGGGDDQGCGIAVDSAGSAYITGLTSSVNFPTHNALQTTFGGSYDAIIAKLSPDGTSLVYSTYLGGSGDDHGYGIVVDTSGSPYITGTTGSTNFPTYNPLQAAFGGSYDDAFITKLSPDGRSLDYSAYLGGSDEDYGQSIAVDRSGSAYLTGYTFSVNFPIYNALQAIYGGNATTDAFVTKIDLLAPPRVEAHITGNRLPSSNWYTGDVVVQWQVTDSDAAITSTSGCTTTTISTDTAGTTLTCSATYSRGTVNKSVTIKRDTVAPNLVDSGPTSSPNDSGWYNSSVSNGFSASDALSGLADPSRASFSASSGSAEGSAVTIPSGPVADLAGNTNPGLSSRSYKIDLHAPVIVGGGATGGMGDSGWYTGPVTEAYTASDALSGLALASKSSFSVSSGSAEGSTVTIPSGPVTDMAGNTNAGMTSGPYKVDLHAPTTIASLSTPPNAAGWNNGPVTVTLDAVDTGGSGVKEIHSSVNGGAERVDSGGLAQLNVKNDGITTITYYARDVAGNVEGAHTVTVKIDGTGPIVTCGNPDLKWHATDVTIGCSATDASSGLAIPGDSTFSLSTNVAPNTETSNAATGTHTVCDVAGNCSVAGPIVGNRIDKKAPAITIASPTNSTYILGKLVTANASCADGGAGLLSCIASVRNGKPVDTATAGVKSFSVTSKDVLGNTTTQAVSYTVAYDTKSFIGLKGLIHAGAVVPIYLQLLNARGGNVSTSKTIVTATTLRDASGGVVKTLNSKFTSGYLSKPVVGQGYTYRLATTGLAPGTYTLHFTAGMDPTIHGVSFTIK